MASQQRFYGWFLVAALCTVLCINMAFPFYGAAVLNAVMAKDFQLERSTLGLGFTAMVLAQGLLGPVIAKVVSRFGPRRTIFCGALVLAVGALLMATWVSQGWHYVLVFGTMLAVGIGLSTTIPAQTAVTFWFSKRRALALSVVWAAAGMGGFFAAPLLNKVIGWAGGNWRAGWYFIAAAAVVTALIAIVFVRNRPADLGQEVDGGLAVESLGAAAGDAERRQRVHRTVDDWPLREAFWTPANWIIMFCAITFAIPVTVVIAHGVVHLGELGHAPAVAAMGLGLLALASVCGKLIGGYFADSVEPRFIWSAAMVMIGAGLVILTTATAQLEIYAFAMLMGGGQGASIVCRPALVGNYFGPKSFAGMLGAQAPVVTVLTSLAPYAVGLAYDMQRSYLMAFYGLAGLVFLGACVVMFATPPRRSLALASARGLG